MFHISRLELQELESSNKGLEEEKENIKSRLMRTKSTADSKLVSCVFFVKPRGFKLSPTSKIWGLIFGDGFGKSVLSNCKCCVILNGLLRYQAEISRLEQEIGEMKSRNEELHNKLTERTHTTDR